MADDKYTTIRIREDSRQKLNALREGTDLTFSDVIENLLKSVDGTIINDIEEIKRDGIALELRFIDFTSGKGSEYNITFHELRHSKVGDKFYAKTPAEIDTKSYVQEEAEVIFIDEDSVFVRLRETIIEKGKETRLVNMVHIDLF